MPQGRIILKRVSESQKLAALSSDGARLLYSWLIPHLDINGCYSADPVVVKGKVFTRLKKSFQTVEKHITELHEVGLIVVYETNGDKYLYLIGFEEGQPSLNPSKEAKPTIPPPTPDQLQTNSGFSPRKVKESKVKESKEKVKTLFGEFVYLTTAEYKKLEEQFGKTTTDDKITELDDAIGSKGYCYKSHYRTILAWHRRKTKGSAGTAILKPCDKTLHGQRTHDGQAFKKCGRPAVFKGTDDTGQYYYRCEKHRGQ